MFETAYLGLAITYMIANFGYLIHVEHRLTTLEGKLDTLLEIIDNASIIKGD